MSRIVEVLHCPKEVRRNFDCCKDDMNVISENIDSYVKVAEVRTWVLGVEECLEDVLNTVQHLYGSWTQNNHVTFLGEDFKTTRSTMSGDILILDGKKYIVDQFGYGEFYPELKECV